MRIQYSTSAAAETVREWFSNHPNTDIVSLNEVFVAAGRDLNEAELNKRWAGNKLTHLKHYGLVTPVYTHGRRKMLDKVQLTSEGKKALGRTEAAQTSLEITTPDPAVSLQSIAKAIQEFEKQNPSIELDLSVKVRKEVPIS